MRVPSNLPPGVTDSMIEEAQGEGGRAATEATPGPWHLRRLPFNGRWEVIGNVENDIHDPVAFMEQYDDSGIDKANAALIVRAVNRDHHFAPLMEALGNAQDVIHLQFCVPSWSRADDEHWKECREAQAAILAAEKATS